MALTTAAASLIGAGISSLGNFAGGVFSNSLSAYKARKLSEYQAFLNYKYSKNSAINSPLWNRKGLVKAGYNPMLALGNMQGANSNWSSMGSVTTPDMSNIGSNAVSNAMAVKQQSNQDTLTDAQAENYNADSVLKNSQSITELYTQLEKINHADLMAAQKKLTDKDVEWYDKKQAREDLRVANEIERTGNEFKVGMAQAIASQINANANRQISISNAKDVQSRLPINKYEAKIRRWNAKHPYMSRILSGAVSSGVHAVGSMGSALLK